MSKRNPEVGTIWLDSQKKVHFLMEKNLVAIILTNQC